MDFNSTFRDPSSFYEKDKEMHCPFCIELIIYVHPQMDTFKYQSSLIKAESEDNGCIF